MNRTARRALRARAKDAAAQAAAACFDYTPDGNLIRVSDPRAVAVLRRAFEAMLRTARPVTMQISDAEAAAFPRWTNRDAGMIHVLAAWIDPDGRCTYALRSAASFNALTGEPRPLSAAAATEQDALRSLAEITGYAGFPAIHRTEGRA